MLSLITDPHRRRRFMERDGQARACSMGGNPYSVLMQQLLIATRNAHKVQEIRAILGDLFECVSLGDTDGAPEVVEDATTFEGNALKKAETLANWISQVRNSGARGAAGPPMVRMVLADDSGLEVDALDGAPGVHSARFAALDRGQAGNSGDAENNRKLLRLLSGVEAAQRTARFRCVIAVAPVVSGDALAAPRCFSGACEGRIGEAPHGDHGFGYDPLFVPLGFQETFAQLGESTKNRISHRSRALEQLRQWLQDQFISEG